jgi:hypothetical protein
MENSPVWFYGFVDYLVDWVEYRNGSGAILFLWFGVDNSCLGTDLALYESSPKAEDWCVYYKEHYLDKVKGSVIDPLPDGFSSAALAAAPTSVPAIDVPPEDTRNANVPSPIAFGGWIPILTLGLLVLATSLIIFVVRQRPR